MEFQNLYAVFAILKRQPVCRDRTQKYPLSYIFIFIYPLRSLLKIPSSFPPDLNNLLINVSSHFCFCLYDSSHPSSSSFNTYLSLSLQFDQQSYFESLFNNASSQKNILAYLLNLLSLLLFLQNTRVFPISNMFIYFLLLLTCFCVLVLVFRVFLHFIYSTDLVSLCKNVCTKAHCAVSLFQFSENCSRPLGSCS